MDDRIQRLQETAARLSHELGQLRQEIADLRGDAPTTSTAAAGGSPSVPESRVDAMNAAFVRQSAEPTSTAPAGAGATGAPTSPRPASSWGDVFKTLGVQPPPAPTVRTWRANSSPITRQSLEDLIGRYGTIALASLTILMGIGALIGWAVRNGYIGPAARVALGLALAAITAFFGWRVRKGDSPRYGNALLALALAIVHVVAWGAGPRLHLISTPAVLALAALSAAALAALAWHDGDQTLFNVGFGGALLAPFVTSDGGGHAVMLLSYGFVVLGAGIASLGQRSWTRAPWVASLGIVVYAASGASLAQGSDAWAVRSAAGAFALGLGALSSVLLDGTKRMAISYPALVTAFGAMAFVANGRTTNVAQYPFALALTIAARFAGETALRGLRTAALGAVLLPAGAAALAIGSLDRVMGMPGAATALLFAALSAAAAWQNVTGDRRYHAFTATALVGLGIALFADEHQLLFCLLMAAFGLGCALATRRLRLGGIALAGSLWLAGATVVAFSMLDARAEYTYRPFLTTASAAAGAVSVAWVLLSFHAARNLPERGRTSGELVRSLVRLLGGLVAFFWIRQELARAVSPDVSAFLVVAWYAVSGVASIFLGHARGLPVLRQLGLGLSVLAALTTIAQASGLAIGWRVGSYLLAGVFLLGVAYSYRVTRPIRGEQRGEEEPASAGPGAP